VRAHAAQSAHFARFFRAAGALLFVVSLAYFFIVYLTSFGVVTSDRDTASAITWNVTIFTLFAVHHSIFARTGIRRWVAQTVPAELERSVYVWIASLLFIAVCAWWRPVAGLAWQTTGSGSWVSWAVQTAGVWLTLRSAIALDFLELAGVRRPEGFRVPDPRESTAAGGLQASEMEFKTTGPYGWVRHPIYAGWFLFVWGASTMTTTRLTFAIVSCLYLLIAIPIEERTMRSQAGDAYGRYMARVRWRLLPGVY
jgi:methanethiol S-methyltransferase